jgi:hypothetical protein
MSKKLNAAKFQSSSLPLTGCITWGKSSESGIKSGIRLIVGLNLIEEMDPELRISVPHNFLGPF